MRHLLIAGLLAGSAAAHAATSAPPIPPAPSPYRNAPAEVRAYLEQARKADLIADPLARCLAWPAIPGADWPAGLVQAHCEYNFAPQLTLAALDTHLREGTLAALDAQLRADLERHYSDTDFSENIHTHFFAFDASEEAGRLTQAWLDAAPDSPFAHTARGHWNKRMAGKARGTKWARETPRENFERMDAYGDAAIEHYDKALELEPRLTEAHGGIIDVASLGGRRDEMAAAVKAARALAPACRGWGHQFMEALTPRWGGSFEEMAQFAATVKPYISERPLASIVAVMPEMTLADELYRAERYDAAEAVAKAATRQTTHIAAYRVAGQSIVAQKSGNQWEALMYLLGESRLADGRAFAARNRGQLIWDLTNDVEWAALAIQRAVDLEPENAWGQWLLGGVRATQGRVDEAEAAYLEAMRDPEQRRSALKNLSALLITREQVPRAARYVKTLTTEYPDYGWGWYFNTLVVVDRKGGSFSPDDAEVMRAFDKFEETADHEDPEQVQMVQQLRESRRQMEKMMRETERLNRMGGE